MITIYGIKNCDSVKKAIKFFQNNSLEFNFIDFNTTPPNLTTINDWLTKASLEQLFNNRSTTYRNLKLKEKNLTDEEKKSLLSKENRLIKRPVIEYNDQLIVGYNIENYKQIFL